MQGGPDQRKQTVLAGQLATRQSPAYDQAQQALRAQPQSGAVQRGLAGLELGLRGLGAAPAATEQVDFGQRV